MAVFYELKDMLHRSKEPQITQEAKIICLRFNETLYWARK